MVGLSHVKSNVLSNEWPHKNECMVDTKIKALQIANTIICGIALSKNAHVKQINKQKTVLF